jgi:hypothetical protein
VVAELDGLADGEVLPVEFRLARHPVPALMRCNHRG